MSHCMWVCCMPIELLLDNARVLVRHHDAATREVEFTDRLHALPGIGTCDGVGAQIGRLGGVS